MAIWYVDHLNGNDSNDGQTFANRKRTLDAIDSLVSAGDTVRVAKSPDPTLVTNSGTVRGLPSNANYYGVSISGTYSTTANETNIAYGNHALETGYTIQIQGNSQGKNLDGVYEVTKVDANNFKIVGYTAPSNGTISGGYWRNITSNCVTLGAAVTQNIASTGQRSTTWTASSDVTTQFKTNNSQWSSDGSWCEHAYSDEIDIAAGFGTGKAAYWELPATLDLSGYQQVSLKMCQPSGKYTGDLTNGNFSIRLCTDTTGDTSVHTVPCVMAYGPSNGWRAIVKDFGANLNSAIKSVALYVDSDQGAQKIRINNIIACKASSSADSLTHKSLIGLNTTADKSWYAIASISGTRVQLITCAETYNGGKIGSYYDAGGVYFSINSTSASIYKREVIETSTGASSVMPVSSNQYIDVWTGSSGTDGSPITISCGWDPSGSMTTQNGKTYLSGTYCWGYFYMSSSNYCVLEKLFIVNGYRGLYFESCSYLTLTDVGSTNVYNYGVNIQSCPNLRGADIAYSVQAYNNNFRLNGGSLENPGSTVVNIDNCITTYGNQPCVSFQYTQNLVVNKLTAYMTKGGSGHVSFQGADAIKITTAKIGMVSHYSGETGLDFWEASDCKITNLTVYGCYYAITPPQSPAGAITPISNFGVSIDNLETVRTTNSHNTSSSQSPVFGVHGSASRTGALQINGGTIRASTGLYIQYGGVFKIKGITFDCSTDVSTTKTGNWGAIFIRDYDGTSGDYRNLIGTWTMKGWINSETTTRHTASGYAWKFDISSAALDLAPLRTCVANIAVAASAVVTVTVYVYRTSVNTKGRLRLKGSNGLGVADVTATSSGSASSWEQLSAQITPANAGILEIDLEAYKDDSTGDVIFDDITVSQA